VGEEIIFELDTKEALEILKAMSIVREDTNIKLTKDGIMTRIMDDGHFTMYEMHLTRDLFYTYNVDTEKTVAFSVKNILKTIKTKEGVITFEINDKIKASIKGDSIQVYEFPILKEGLDELTILPPINFNSEISLEVETEIIRKAIACFKPYYYSLGPFYITINDTLEMSLYDKYKMFINVIFDNSQIVFHKKPKARNEFEFAYMSYVLFSMLNVNLAPIVKMEFRLDGILKISYELRDQSVFTYYLTPLVPRTEYSLNPIFS